jgi:hypothetical protein
MPTEIQFQEMVRRKFAGCLQRRYWCHDVRYLFGYTPGWLWFCVNLQVRGNRILVNWSREAIRNPIENHFQ